MGKRRKGPVHTASQPGTGPFPSLLPGRRYVRFEGAHLCQVSRGIAAHDSIPFDADNPPCSVDLHQPPQSEWPVVHGQLAPVFGSRSDISEFTPARVSKNSFHGPATLNVRRPLLLG